MNFVLQEGAAEAAPEADATPPASADDLAPSSDLDVDVEVQTLPDLDVIILRGRDSDVQKLTEIIQELERLSRETQPQIRIYQLKHAPAKQLRKSCSRSVRT